MQAVHVVQLKQKLHEEFVLQLQTVNSLEVTKI
jgi:hypothetical protein